MNQINQKIALNSTLCILILIIGSYSLKELINPIVLLIIGTLLIYIIILYISKNSYKSIQVINDKISNLNQKYELGIKNVLKKSTNTPYLKEQNLSFGKILIHKDTHQVLLNNKEIKLTITEFSLLSLLVSKNKVFTRQELIDLVWGDNVIISDRSVDVHIRNIRIKIGKQHGDMIKTISGKGYGIIESYEPN